MMNLHTALLALSTVLPLAACGSAPGADGDPFAVPEDWDEPIEEGGGITGDAVSVDFAGGKYEFVQPLGANGDGLGVLLNVQLEPGQANAVEEPLSQGATNLELFLGLSPEGTQAPPWLIEDHAEALVRRGRPAGELRELSIEPPAVEKAFSTSGCSMNILGPNRYRGLGYYEQNNLSGYLDYSLNDGYDVSGRGMMGICNDHDVQALVWYRVEADGELVGEGTNRWIKVPAGKGNSLYYEGPGFQKMRMRAQGKDFHARARWVKVHFEGYDGPF